MASEPLAELVAPFQFLVGRWQGEGRGLWAASPPFRYLDELTVELVPGRALLRIQQRTKVAGTGSPSHMESGFMRLFEAAELELLLITAAGYTEIHAGHVDGTTLRLRPSSLALAGRARPLSRVERQLELRGSALHSSVAIAVGPGAAVGHVESVLHRLP